MLLSTVPTKCCCAPFQYELERGEVWLPSGLSPAHWLQTAAVLVIMGSAVSGACLVVKVFDNVGIRTLAVGLALLAEYVCLRSVHPPSPSRSLARLNLLLLRKISLQVLLWIVPLGSDWS